ncbi:MAG TPA: FAD-dependent oxidoreductase [Kamptonema sp.]|nr:FAD-dependent oxidoreductase [Kamptonema sp.]
MQQIDNSKVKDLVLIGGGHSHAIVLRMFGIKPLPGVRLTLISDVTHAAYSGMLPGHVAGFYNYDECHIDLRSLSQFAQAQIFIDKAIALDLDKNRVICSNRSPVSFDLLSIDIGSTPNTLSVPGAAAYAIPAKPVPEFLANWNQLIEQRQNSQKTLNIAIVGGGAGGVELALNMQTRLLAVDEYTRKNVSNQTDKASIKSVTKFYLFHRDSELMTTHNQLVQRRLKEILIGRGIQLHLAETVCTIDKQNSDLPISNYQILCKSGLKVECDRIFWVTQASAPDWLEKSGLSTNKQGFIQVNDQLQSISHPNIFAAGDIAAMINHPRPKAGVFAVRQGKPLFKNLQRFLLEKPLKPFVPQKQYLGLIGTGKKSAIASRGPFMWESPLLWHWKDWIDRQFMGKFQ